MLTVLTITLNGSHLKANKIMRDPIKIWHRLSEVFTDIDDKAVKTVTLPRRYLTILMQRPIHDDSYINFLHLDLVHYVDNPMSKKHRNIWGARIKIGPRITASAN